MKIQMKTNKLVFAALLALGVMFALIASTVLVTKQASASTGSTNSHPAAGQSIAGFNPTATPCAVVPDKPILWYPQDGLTLTDKKMLLFWLPSNCVQEYTLIVKRDYSVGIPILNTDVTGNRYAITLTRGHTYYWSVKACDWKGCTSSGWRSFTIQYLTYQENDPSVMLSDWEAIPNSQASGGTFRQNVYTNASATYSFTGTSITWVTTKASYQGKASVTIDGVDKGTFDLHSATTQFNVQIPFTGLSNSKHTLVIKNASPNNSAEVIVDALIVGGKTIQSDALGIQYDDWVGAKDSNASGGSYRYSDISGSDVTFYFTGTSVNWVTATGPAYGKAEVFIDWVSKGTIDLYSPTQHWQVLKTFGGLTNKSHFIEIKVLGTKNSLSSGNRVVFDAYSTP